VEEINNGNLRKGGDSDLKAHLFNILNNHGLEGLRNFQVYKTDYEFNNYNMDKIQEEVLHIWEGLKHYNQL
jgi:hypothetical protein